jgi:hypothetical protein
MEKKLQDTYTADVSDNEVLKLIKINITNYFNNTFNLRELNLTIENETTLIIDIPIVEKTITYTLNSNNIWVLSYQGVDVNRIDISKGEKISNKLITIIKKQLYGK